jgi:deoxyribonuclease-4
MFHIGSAKDFGRKKSLELVVKGINKILSGYKGKTQFLIENSAGAGEIIGDTFEEIGIILKKIKNKNVGVCLDTCHLFASGYDLRTPKSLSNTLNNFEKSVGLKKLKVLHLNDSLVPLNARKDRHADIGFGELGEKTFKLIINHPKLKHLDAILETPEIKINYKQTILLLKKLSK